MRKINLIIILCSATRANRNFTVEDLEACHKARGYRTIGYHYYITKDGEIYPCRPEEYSSTISFVTHKTSLPAKKSSHIMR